MKIFTGRFAFMPIVVVQILVVLIVKLSWDLKFASKELYSTGYTINSAQSAVKIEKCGKLNVSSPNQSPPDQRTSNNSVVAKDSFVIPNIVHYVWFQHKLAKPFGFQNYLSVLSAHKRLQPDVIYFHCDKEPEGQYWTKVKSIPSVKVKHRDRPREIFGHKLNKDPAYETSDSNIVRIMVILEYGGIYLDADVIVVRSMDQLRHHQCVLGLENSWKSCAGIILGAPHATFLYLWINYFIEDYQVNIWSYNSGIVPSKLYKRYPNLIHIEPKRLQRPSWSETKKIWGTETFNWMDNYTVHLWYRLAGLKNGTVPTHENIKNWPGVFGELARYTLFDTLPDRLKNITGSI